MQVQTCTTASTDTVKLPLAACHKVLNTGNDIAAVEQRYQ